MTPTYNGDSPGEPSLPHSTLRAGNRGWVGIGAPIQFLYGLTAVRNAECAAGVRGCTRRAYANQPTQVDVDLSVPLPYRKELDNL